MKIYYDHGKLKIRSMLEGDAQAIIEVFQSYGWNNKIETYLGYFKDQETGIRNVYKQRGMGSALLDVIEKDVARFSDEITLAVGLHYGYGDAQRLYVKRGYVPDGSGVWYNSEVLEQYAECCNDDSLVLYMSKKLC